MGWCAVDRTRLDARVGGVGPVGGVGAGGADLPCFGPSGDFPSSPSSTSRRNSGLMSLIAVKRSGY